MNSPPRIASSELQFTESQRQIDQDEGILLG
jgi:hypothetical protein